MKLEMLRCEARIVPINERKMRECGLPADEAVANRWLCRKHAIIVKRKMRAALERQAP